ncbi:MAG TPA: transglycosylase SLT domain-containing protein [Candidatus Eremiobacteraeota bacterium]|nr:transglycosylase SLT domain-containing protein [Candidatus Eremiobacteraeota bacterium]
MFGIINSLNQGAINAQQGIFTNRLVDGTKSGQLNKAEFMALANYDQDTRELEGKFLEDGKLTWQERQILEQRNKYNQRMLALYSRGDFNPVTEGPENEIEARMQNQLSRTYNGLTDGSLTREEGIKTLNYQGETATKYGKLQASPNGLHNRIFDISTFTPAERLAIHRRLDISSEQIYNLRHNWRSDGGVPQNPGAYQPPYAPDYYGGFPSYTLPVNFPNIPFSMGAQPPLYPGFPGGGCPPYVSSLTQMLFAGMQMMQMMQMMGFGIPPGMFGGGMAMAMPAFMLLSNMMGGMNMMSGGAYGGAYAGVGPGGAYGGAYAGSFGNVMANPNMQISRIDNPNKQQVGMMLQQAAAKYGIPVNILKAVAWNESRWNAGAVGDHGQSHGVMQIYAKAHPQAYQGMENVGNSTAKNIEYGAKLLRTLYNKYGSWDMAVKRYNGSGPMADAYAVRVMGMAQSQPWRQAGLA